MPSQPSRPRLEVEDNSDVTVVTFIDKKILEEEKIQIIGDQLFSLLEQGRKKLLLNFKYVEFMSSATLGMLIRVRKKVQAGGGQVVLCHITPQLMEAFVITAMDKVFAICPGEQEALQTFK